MNNATTYKWEGRWRQLRGKVKEEWNELTDDELDAAEGRAEVLLGKIQEKYGVSRERAARRIDQMYREL